MLHLLVSKPGAAKAFARQLCWHETIVRFFIREPHTVNAESMKPGVQFADSCQPLNQPNPLIGAGDHNGASAPPGGASDIDVSNNSNSETHPFLGDAKRPDTLDVSDANGEPKLSHDGASRSDASASDANSSGPPTPSGGVVRPTVLDISNGNSNNSSALELHSLQTPLFIQAQREELTHTSDDDRSRSISRSSSTSTEDLTNPSPLTPRSSSIPSSASSQSVTDRCASPVPGGRRSAVESETFQRALENIGLRKDSMADNQESMEVTEELCQNLLICLITIMWKGTEGSDKSAWKVSFWFFTL